ncbi:MAG: hypothetical protein SVJ22_05255 [Halobacteriota archaeon]|nr:hypothetical protein [Halobacteriota archaeon]
MSEMQHIEKNEEVFKRNPGQMCNSMSYESSLYKSKGGVCDGKLLLKEPLLMASENLKVLRFLPSHKIHKPYGYDWKLKNSDDDIPLCLYLCENGHINVRPSDSADVPIVPPGSIENPVGGTYNKPQSWYTNMSPQDRSILWGLVGVEFTPLDKIPENLKKYINIDNYEKNK